MNLNREVNGKREEEEKECVGVLLTSLRDSAPVARNNSGNDEIEASTLLLQNASGVERGVLETLEERRGRRISHLVLHFTSFIVAIGFSIVLTGVWPYLRQLEPGVSKGMLGWVIAANPIGQMFASPLLGAWSNRVGSNRIAFIATMALFSFGNFLYAVLSVFGSATIAIMIFSRFIVGVSSANMTLIRSYVSASTTVKERTTVVSIISASQAIGYIIGPAIQTALAVAFSEGSTSETTNSTFEITSTEEEMQEDDVGNIGLQWNMYTATGWISCILGLLNLFLFLPCIYQEYNIAAKEAQLQKLAANDETSKLPKPDYVSLSGILITFFVSVMIYVLIETLIVPMCMDLYAWNDEKAITIVGTGLSIAAVLCLLIFVALGFITKIVDERKVLIIGIISMLLSGIIFMPMGNTYAKMKNCTSVHSSIIFNNETLNLDKELIGDLEGESPKFVLTNTTQEPHILVNKSENELDSKIDLSSRVLSRQRRHVSQSENCEDTGCPLEQQWCLYTPIIEKSQLIIGSICGVFGYPVAFTISSALFSKVLGPKPQGVWMGILISTGSLSRATGPIIVSYIYTELGTRWTFSVIIFCMLCVLALNVVIYKRLVPMDILRKR